MATWKLLDLQDKWNTLSESLNVMGDTLSVKSMEIPNVNNSSAEDEFRHLVKSLKSLKTETIELGKEIRNHSDTLAIEVKHFHDLAHDYESEVDIYKKGREQAFQLYDNLAQQQKVLLVEYESLKAEFKAMSDRVQSTNISLAEADELLRSGQAANVQLVEELSTLRIELFGLQKKLEILEEDNQRMSQLELNESHDRNDLIEKIAKEVKSRNDALVLAEAARSELSRLLVQSEQDRLARETAQGERDDAVGSVDALNDTIEALKQAVEENEKMYKHEVLMRHKIEESLLGLEDTVRNLQGELDQAGSATDEAHGLMEAAIAEKAKALEAKESLVSQIATLASTMAKDKQEIESLMKTLMAAQAERSAAVESSEDSLEKAKQMERVINQLIQDKAELDNANAALLEEKRKIMEDSNNVVELRARLEGQVAKLDAQLVETKSLFENEKKFKEEAAKGQKVAEGIMTKNQEELAKVKEASLGLTKERDELRTTLESVQKVLQGERQVRGDLERALAKSDADLLAIRKTAEDEKRMKDDTVRSLEAESRSKLEAIKQLEEAKKAGEKVGRDFEKMKLDLESAKEKLKEEERAKKEVGKQIDEMKKESNKAATEAEKVLRAKEELTRKLEAEAGISKDAQKQLTIEKTENEKLSKSLAEERAGREKAERDLEAAKASSADAQKGLDSERVEHGKTYKAYESERDARAKLEAELVKAKDVSAGEIGKAKAEAAQFNADLKGCVAEKNACEKRIEKLEAKLAQLADEKQEATRGSAQASALKKSLEQEQRAREDLEAKMREERRRMAEMDGKVADAKAVADEGKVRVQNLTLENKKLVSKLERLENELSEERRVKNDLVKAMSVDRQPA